MKPNINQNIPRKKKLYTEKFTNSSLNPLNVLIEDTN